MEQPLSEQTLRYRRNTLAILFVVTVLLLIPGVQVGELSVLGVSIEKGTPHAGFWVWAVILVLLVYQLCMFFTYAIPDAQGWLADKKVNQLPVWFEVSKFWLAKPFRIAFGINEIKERKSDGIFRFKYIDTIRNVELGATNMSVENIESNSYPFKRMLVVEIGLPAAWLVVIVVCVFLYSVFGIDIRTWIGL